MSAARFGGAQSATLSPLHDTKRSRIVEVVCDVSFCLGEHPSAISMSRRDPYPRLTRVVRRKTLFLAHLPLILRHAGESSEHRPVSPHILAVPSRFALLTNPSPPRTQTLSKSFMFYLRQIEERKQCVRRGSAAHKVRRLRRYMTRSVHAVLR